MSKLPEVTPNNITKIRQIGPAFKAIYAVTAEGSNFVIKREQTDYNASVAASNNWANKIMRKATDGGSVLKVKNLTKPEITAFLQYLAKREVHDKLMADARAKGPAEEDDCRYSLEGLHQNGNTVLFVKMPYNKKLAQGTDLDDRGTLSIAENTAIWFKAIDKSSFWKSLGKISAIDHFNSNFDRIGFALGGEQWEVINPGNLMIFGNKALPIDAWNSSKFTSAEGNYTMALDEKVKRGLDVIRDAQERDYFLSEVMDSIFAFLNINAPRHGFTMEEAAIKNNYTVPFRNGYDEGVRSVKQVMMQKIAQYGGDKHKKSHNPFAEKKFGQPTSNAINNVKYSSNANNRLLQNDQTPFRSNIPQGLILRMEYLNWI